MSIEVSSNSNVGWTAKTGDAAGLEAAELAGMLGVSNSDITSFQGIGSGDSFAGWSFKLGGVDFTLAPDGKISFKREGSSVSLDPSINIGDNITAEEAAAFENIIRSMPPRDDDGRTQGFQFGANSLFGKMLYSIANQMNEMFMDILAMSTVLSNGTGLRGIMLLAEKGITIDGVSVQSMLDNTQAEAVLTAFGEMLENNAELIGITDIKGTVLASGDFDTVRLQQNDGFTDLDLSKVEGLTFTLTAPDGKVSMDNIDVKLSDHESILESPGTLFLIQQLLQQMKDAMQAIGAVGKVGGDVSTTAVQSFVRDMNG